jgi:hypothetical protein
LTWVYKWQVLSIHGFNNQQHIVTAVFYAVVALILGAFIEALGACN